MKIKSLDGIDQRAHKFFNRNFTGGQDRSYYFDTDHEKLIQTTYIQNGSNDICGHCGDKCYPIQANIPSSYDTTGYTCICKGAMDEVDAISLVAEVRNQLSEAISVAKPDRAGIQAIQKKISIKALTNALKEAESNDDGRLFFTVEAIKPSKVIYPSWMSE